MIPAQYLGLYPFMFKNSATQAADYVRSATNVLSGFKGWGAKTTTTTTAASTSAAPAAAAGAQSTTATTSVWSKWAPAAYAVGGALIAGAAAGTAYYKRDDIGTSYTWVSDHMKYVGNLWSQAELEERLSKLLEIESRMGVLFHTYVRSQVAQTCNSLSLQVLLVSPGQPARESLSADVCCPPEAQDPSRRPFRRESQYARVGRDPGTYRDVR